MIILRDWRGKDILIRDGPNVITNVRIRERGRQERGVIKSGALKQWRKGLELKNAGGF